MNTDKEYDVVIVGSGIAGAVMAKTLTQAGKTVLLLEAGLQAGINMDKEGNYQSYIDYLNTYYKAGAKVPNSPYPNIKDAPSIDVLNIRQIKGGKPSTEGYLVQRGPVPFGSDCLRGPGGTTLHWLGSTPRMLPNDFQMKTLYNQGVDWPFTYDKLVPYYKMAELEIGVAGDVGGIKWPEAKDEAEQASLTEKYYGKDYVFPMEEIPVSYLDKVVTTLVDLVNIEKVTFNGKPTEIGFSTTPQGRNSIPNKNYHYRDVVWNSGTKELVLHDKKYWSTEHNKVVDSTGGEEYRYLPVGATWDPYTGQRCEGNASCVPICPVQAKYNALKTLYKADKNKLTIKTQSVASKVLRDESTKQVTGIEYKTYSTADGPGYETHIAKGKIYVLGASAIENAKILLASDNAANSSDQVGRNLMDHLCLLTWGLLPAKGYPFRGPGSTTNMSSFRDGTFREQHTAWICPIDNWGWGWPMLSPESDLDEALKVVDGSGDGLFGEDLRNHLADRIPKQLLLHYECEQQPDPENRVTIEEAYNDPLDNPRPVIRYDISEYIVKAFEAAKNLNDQLFEAADITDYTTKTQMPYSNFVPKNYKKKQDAEKIDKVEEGKPVEGYNFWGAGHIVGTHRMGKVGEEKSSVVDENCRTWDHDNLYLVGCGSMPTLGTSNPTLTMTAMTFKAAEAILKQLSEKTI